MIQLSIIIPIYNVADYVERCILSLENQDIDREEFEIICVNDGSLDNSKELIENLQKRFNNIHLINQENQGVSRARNNGIGLAKGENLLFIDPDDYVKPNSINASLSLLRQTKAQVCFMGFLFLNADGSKRQEVYDTRHNLKIINGIDAYFLTRRNNPPDPDRMWAILFDASLMKLYKLQFLPDVPFLEDGELIARILCVADRCILDSRPFYYRTTRIGSATNSKLFHTERASRGFLAAAHNLKEFQQRELLDPRQIAFLNQPICKFVLLTLNSSIRKPYLKTFRETRTRLNEYGLLRLNTNNVVWPYLYYAFLYNHFPFMFLLQAWVQGWKSKLKAFFKPKES